MSDKADLKQALEQLTTAIQTTTELFYTQHEAEGYQAFGMLLGPMSTVLDKLFAAHGAGVIELDEQELLRLLTEAMNAMEQRDGVLLADILQYDFLDQMEQMKNQLD